MKDIDTSKKLLGLSQEEIAIILDITRSQWSMFDIGKRELPLHAALEYTKILEYIQLNQTKEIEIQNFMKVNEKRIYDVLEREMKENTYKLNRLNRKIEQAQRFYDDGLAALRIVAYLQTQPENERTVSIKNLIKCKAMVNLQKNSGLLSKYTIDKQVLKMRNAAIAKILKDPDTSA